MSGDPVGLGVAEQETWVFHMKIGVSNWIWNWIEIDIDFEGIWDRLT